MYILYTLIDWLTDCLSSDWQSVYPFDHHQLYTSFLSSIFHNFLPSFLPSLVPFHHSSVPPSSLLSTFLPSFLSSFLVSSPLDFLAPLSPSIIPTFYPSFFRHYKLPNSFHSFVFLSFLVQSSISPLLPIIIDHLYICPFLSSSYLRHRIFGKPCVSL